MSITLDNASSNDSMVDFLKPDLNLMCNGEYFHIRCCAHILNVIVQEGSKDMDDAIFKVRESVKYRKVSQSRKHRFSSCVQHVNLESVRGLRQDVPTRWNSIFHMLENALYYRRAFNNLAKTDLNYLHYPTEVEWEKIGKICKFLKVFYDVSCVFSGTKFPTANLYFTHVLRVGLLLKEEMGSKDAFIRGIATKMLTKKNCESHNLELELFKDKLFELYNQYVSFASDYTPSVSNGVNDYDCYASNAFNSAGKTELELYLEEPILPRSADVNELEYWRTHCVRYPVLAQMFQDILAIPISTVASESSFSIGVRILDPYRNSLKPSTVEALVCLRCNTPIYQGALPGTTLEYENTTISVTRGKYIKSNHSRPIIKV
ncbi:zinc finger BED domain-containing protein RICESLEEPER 2-like [Silene latifolia]|uniref:zinc finger BED domain-containing protein RICESLEEPER 2-like n=1 Tax=Silene latifolia TaxID=37657 RepID=UPI003D77F1A2